MSKRGEVISIILRAIAEDEPSSLYELHKRLNGYEEWKGVNFSVVLRNVKSLEANGYVKLVETDVRRAKKPLLTAKGLIHFWELRQLDYITLLKCLGRLSDVIAKMSELSLFKDEGFVKQIVETAIPSGRNQIDLELLSARMLSEELKVSVEPKDPNRIFTEVVEKEVVEMALPRLLDSELKSLDKRTRERMIEIVTKRIEWFMDQVASYEKEIEEMKKQLNRLRSMWFQ